MLPHRLCNHPFLNCIIVHWVDFPSFNNNSSTVVCLGCHQYFNTIVLGMYGMTANFQSSRRFFFELAGLGWDEDGVWVSGHLFTFSPMPGVDYFSYHILISCEKNLNNCMSPVNFITYWLAVKVNLTLMRLTCLDILISVKLLECGVASNCVMVAALAFAQKARQEALGFIRVIRWVWHKGENTTTHIDLRRHLHLFTCSRIR